MEQVTLNFTANEQILTLCGETYYASDTINYIEACFDLGDNWSGYDSVRAVWFNDFNTISTLLDSNGTCAVPMEVMKRKGKVYVNLVGSIVDNDTVTDRLTTYPVVAICIDAKARVNGTETGAVTPSQFEQYVTQVTALVGSVKDIDSVVLNADYTLTINFSDGTSTTTTSIRGAQGEQGIQGETGATGATGNGISSIAKTGTSGLVDTYTITFTDGTTTTFTVTNGEVSMAQLESVLPTDTASGSIASFSDGCNLFNAKSVVIGIEPQQSGSGDPSPSNIRPISGWTGAEVTRTGKNLVNKADGSLSPNGRGIAFGASYIGTADGSLFLSAGSYTFSLSGANSTVAEGIYVYDSSGASVKTVYSNKVCSFTAPSDGAYKIEVNIQTALFVSWDNYDIQLELGSTATAYEPYNGTTYPISWQTEAGTVYGGELNVTTGVLTVTHAMVDIGTLHWTYETGNQRFFTTGLNSLAKMSMDNNFISSAYVKNTTTQDGTGFFTSTGLMLYNRAYTDAIAFKQAMSGVQLCYELATPTTYQLTPTDIALLQGQNNVWADTGDTEVTYKADIQRWVTKKINALI